MGELYELDDLRALLAIERAILENITAAYHADNVDYARFSPFHNNQTLRIAAFEKLIGETIANDQVERNHRFLEEALELVQSLGCTRSEAHQLVDYTFDRPLGEAPQEAGGVMVTLAALCLAAGIDMHVAGEAELERIWTKVETIRAKQATKPKHSPLPALKSAPVASDGMDLEGRIQRAWVQYDPGRPKNVTVLRALQLMEDAFFAGYRAALAPKQQEG